MTSTSAISATKLKRGRKEMRWPHLFWAWEAVYTQMYGVGAGRISVEEATRRALKDPVVRNSIHDIHGQPQACEVRAARLLRDRYNRFEVMLANAGPDSEEQFVCEANLHKAYVVRQQAVLARFAESRSQLDQIRRDIYIGKRPVPGETLDEIFVRNYS